MTELKHHFSFLFFIGLFLSISENSNAYTIGRTPGGLVSKWPNNTSNLYLNYNFSSLGLGNETLANSAFELAINDWNTNLGSGNPNFIATNGRAVNASDGINSVTFSNSSELGSAVAGLTLISYDASSGYIKEADILFNADITNLSSYPNVFRHELGHFIGLAHSEVLDAVMVYEAFDANSHVHTDDLGGARSLYGNDSDYGVISGSVEGGNFVGVFGAHVQAISSKTGSIVASDITDTEGTFSIKGLSLSDSYYVYVSPLKNLSVLPSFYNYVRNDFCPGVYVGKFFTSCSGDTKGRPEAISFNYHSSPINVGTISIGCDSGVNSQYMRARLGISSTPTISLIPTVEGDLADTYVGNFLPSDLTSTTAFTATDSYKIDLSSITTSGLTVDIKVVSMQLGSPQLLKATLSRSGASVSSVASGSGSIHLSSALSTTTASNIYTLKIQAKKSDLDLLIPAASSYLDTVSRYLVITNLKNGSGTIVIQKNNLVIEDNRTCLSGGNTFSAQRAQYVVKTSLATSKKSNNSDSNGSPISCGTIDDTQPPTGPMTGMFIFAMPLLFIWIKRNILLS